MVLNQKFPTTTVQPLYKQLLGDEETVDYIGSLFYIDDLEYNQCICSQASEI